jgi:drug/metabolite transporter (DMT)-like permease
MTLAADRPPAVSRMSSPSRDRYAGIGLMCAALACFACLDASAKWLGRSMDPLQVTWVRYAVSVVMVSAVLNPWSRPGLLRTKKPWLQALRSLLLVASTALNFVALQYLQLAESISIIFMTPMLVALLAGPMLGEWAGPRRLIAIGVGFAGVLVITRPGFGGLHPAAILSVIGCVAYAFYNLLTRLLAAHDSSDTTMFYSGIAGVVVMTPVLPFVWSLPSGGLVWAIMILLGGFGALGHWFIIQAHRRAPAGTLAPFIYSQIIWMVSLGWLVFDQWPDRWTFIGGSIVIASGLYLLYRERVRGVDKVPAA